MNPTKYLLASLCLLLAACAPQLPNNDFFRKNDVSCTDTSTQEMRERYEKIYNSPDNELLWVFGFHWIEPDLKIAANHGYPPAMAFYGSIAFGTYRLKFYDVPEDRKVFIETMPGYYKKSTVRALTYEYMATLIEGMYTLKAKEMLSHTFQDGFYRPRVPEQWFKEAKANAEAWKAWCDHQPEHANAPR